MLYACLPVKKLKMAKVSEVYGGRISSTILCSVLHQICLLMAYSAFMNADPLHPKDWLRNWYSKQKVLPILVITSISLVLTLLQVIFFSKRMIRGVPFSPTRLLTVVDTFCVDNLIMLSLNVMTGFAMGYMYIKNNNITSTKNDDDFVVTLLLMSFTGAYFFVTDYIHGCNHIQFPTVSGLSAKSQLRNLLINCMIASIKPAIKVLIYFNTIYYFCGESLSKSIISLPGINVSENFVGHLSFSQVINTWNLLSSWLLSFLVLVVLLTMKSITSLLLSCSWYFPISVPDEDHVLLSQALSFKSLPAVQQLASQDLMVVAETDPARRAEIYVLSQPGGHPHNWKAIINPILSAIDKMCSDLSLSPPVVIAKPAVLPQDVPLPQSPQLRNMSPGLMNTKLRSHENSSSCTTLSSKARGWLKHRLDLLLKKPPMAFLFGERTEARIAHALTLHGQSVANLVSALSTLVQASYTEDSYGVVQQDLPSLIVSLLKLKTAIDKLGSLFRKPNKPTQSLPHLHIKSVLREATVRSIYKIVVVFKPHLNDLMLSADIKQQLQGFTEFKES